MNVRKKINCPVWTTKLFVKLSKLTVCIVCNFFRSGSRRFHQSLKGVQEKDVITPKFK